MNITCTCCTKDSGHPATGNIAEAKRISGYKAIFSVRNGLEVLFICPDCATKISSLANQIKDIFPEEHNQYLHWSNLTKIL